MKTLILLAKPEQPHLYSLLTNHKARKSDQSQNLTENESASPTELDQIKLIKINLLLASNRLTLLVILKH